MHRILVAAVAGLIAGLILFRGLGLRFVGVPLRNGMPAPADSAGPRGALEAQRLQGLHDQRQEDLKKRLAAAERDCAELRAKVAAAPKTPREPSREEKIKTLGRLITRILRLGPGRRPTLSPEIQKMLGQFMRLCTELGVDMTNSTTMFKNPEFTGGIFEGMLDEYGIADPDARLEWKAGLASRLQGLGDNPGALAIQKMSAENLLDFYNRFGERLFEKDPAAARALSAMSSGSAASISPSSRAQAAEYLLKDVAATVKLDDASKARLQPIAERWAAEYGTLIAEATQAHGDKFMSSMMAPDLSPMSDEAALTEIRSILRFRSSALGMEARALDEMASLLDPDQAARLRKFDKALYFKKITE
jgi:hypothetical protein